MYYIFIAGKLPVYSVPELNDTLKLQAGRGKITILDAAENKFLMRGTWHPVEEKEAPVENFSVHSGVML